MNTPICLIAIIAGAFVVAPSSGQEFTLTTTAANLVASRSIISVAELAGNPDAIIIATPLGNTAKLNPHPIGAWYYGGKWSIFNTDHAVMPVGLTYKVQYFLKRSASEFLQIIGDTSSGGGTFIDSPALDGNPNAQFTIFQNHAPDDRAAGLNQSEARAEYDAASGKWLIKNVNGKRLFMNTAYNIVVTSSGAAAPPPPLAKAAPIVLAASPVPPALAAPLAPVTVVARMEWALPFQGGIQLSSGQCKIVYGTYANPAILPTDTVIVTGQAASDGAYLKWTAAVENGAVHFNVCNWKKMTLSAPDALDLNGRKVNILVLR